MGNWYFLAQEGWREGSVTSKRSLSAFHAQIFAIWSLIPNSYAMCGTENQLTFCAVVFGDIMEIKMYKKFISALYVINIVSQAIFTLLTPIALGFGISWLLVRYASVPSWIYAVLITLGALIGFYSMIKFVLSAMASLDRLEKSRSTSKKTNNTGNNNG